MRLFVLALALASTSALAHVTLETTTAEPNSTHKAVLRVPHGCDGAATTAVTVRLPEGFIAAKPMPKAGWTLRIETGPYRRTYDDHGTPTSEGPVAITWSGGHLEDGHYDEFVVRGRVADLPPGTVLPFATTQTCTEATVAWVELAGPGQEPHALAFPAPVLRVAGGDAPAAGTARVGDLVIEGAWTRATPPGAPVAAGYMTITNTGTEPDTLVGGTAPFAAGVEVHEMAVADGVMSMRPIAGGLMVAPGETVTLSPGGAHVMFVGLTDAPAVGETTTVTLEFARAGTVEVTLPVAAIGAGAAPGGGHGGHGHAH